MHWGTPWGRLVNAGSLVSLGCALSVVGFIRGRWVRLGALWDVGCIRVRKVHWGAPWGSPSSPRVAGLFGVRPRCSRRVQQVSLECALGIAGFIRGRWVRRVEP